ncbi:hypothetical protein M0805_005473 [Coniferiporia weirii]|nr:hypothetical protein M0805_005473 [Coniferiporia weirii]
MDRDVSLPQCPICISVFTEELELVRPNGCGHVICRSCALKLAAKAGGRLLTCVFCIAPSSSLQQVFVSFGKHNISALGVTDTHASAAADGALSAATGASAASFISRGERASRMLDVLAASDPLLWQLPQSGSANDVSLAFACAGRVVCEIGENVWGDSGGLVKSMLMGLGGAIMALQTCYRNVVGFAEEHKVLRRKNKSLLAELESQSNAFEKELERRDGQLAEQEDAKTAREAELTGKITGLQKKLKSMREERESERINFENERSELQQTKSKAVKLWKKYKDREKKMKRLQEEIGVSRGLGNQYGDHASDSSLEVESEHVLTDGEDEPLPLTLDNIFSSSQRSGVSEASLSHLGPDGHRAIMDPSQALKRSSAKPMKKKPPLQRLGSTTLTATTSGPSDTENRPPAPHPSSDFLDSLLAPEIDGQVGMRERGSSAPRSRGAKRRPNTTGVPANPLAARQNPQSLRGREPKRQRLTLGEGGG